MLSSSTALLTASDLSHTSSVPLLAEQLLYLAHGEQALGSLEQIQEPQSPHNIIIPYAFWETLQKIPLSFDYYGLVLQSLQSHPQFWEGAMGQSEEEESPVNEFSDFPWKVEGGSSVGLGLDDYVMLKCLNEESYRTKVSSSVELLTGTVTVPLLRDVLQAAGAASATLLFYEELCPRSQALIYVLEEEIKSMNRVSELYSTLYPPSILKLRTTTFVVSYKPTKDYM